jgi:hypothetical protein
VKEITKLNGSKGEHSAKGECQQIYTSHSAVYVTKAYTKGEMKCAKLIHERICNSTLPSLQEAIHLIQDRNRTHMPALTAKDMKRAIDIFGELVGIARGEMTQKTVSWTVYGNDLVLDEISKDCTSTSYMWMERSSCYQFITILDYAMFYRKKLLAYFISGAIEAVT